MGWEILYGQHRWEMTESDAERLQRLYSAEMSGRAHLFEFDPQGRGGTIRIAVGPGIQLILANNDD